MGQLVNYEDSDSEWDGELKLYQRVRESNSSMHQLKDLASRHVWNIYKNSRIYQIQEMLS